MSAISTRLGQPKANLEKYEGTFHVTHVLHHHIGYIIIIPPNIVSEDGLLVKEWVFLNWKKSAYFFL